VGGGHVACRGEMKSVSKMLVRKVKGGGHSEDLGMYGRIMVLREIGRAWVVHSTETRLQVFFHFWNRVHS